MRITALIVIILYDARARAPRVDAVDGGADAVHISVAVGRSLRECHYGQSHRRRGVIYESRLTASLARVRVRAGGRGAVTRFDLI